MSIAPLAPDDAQAVLAYLGVEAAPPDVLLLKRLIAAYARTVPWESAFRIAKRAATAETAACPRWPDEFWSDALERGGGGTCYESNYAFFALLRALGYAGYLTVNDMGGQVGCHAAIVLDIGGARWLADVGLPLYAPLPLNPVRTTEGVSAFYTYTVQPDGARRYRIERRPHPDRYCFTLINSPVDEAAYRAVVTGDYGAAGLFLDAVIVNKVIDGRLWRFNGRETPYRLQRFENGERHERPIEGDVAQTIADWFAMDIMTVRAALDASTRAG